MKKKYLTLEDIHSYVISKDLANDVYEFVFHWDWFNKRTIGVQFINAIDSIAGNIAEGFGRFHKKDKQKFYYNARASTYESIHWLEQVKTRKLIANSQYKHFYSILSDLPREINYQISLTEKNLKK